MALAVLGCSSGIGLNIVRHALEEGRKVICVTRNPSAYPLREPEVISYEELRSKPPCGIGTFVNAFGVGVLSQKSDLVKRDRLRHSLDVNTVMLLELVDLQIKYFREQRDAKQKNIVVFGSLTTERRWLQQFEYSISKLAVKKLLEDFAVPLHRDGIRLNAITPGYIADSNMMRGTGEKYNQAVQQALPQRKTIEHWEIYKILNTLEEVPSLVGCNLIMSNGAKY